ncbi:hypothetical protein CRUP_033733, partial [Coryphaenoides rupestris]
LLYDIPPRLLEDLSRVLDSGDDRFGWRGLVPNSAGSELKATQRRRFTYRDVLQGTWHFHHQMKIAEGRFSDTYKGTLGEETFAVKLFKPVNDRSWKERWDLFTREMEGERLSQHPNILDLLGCLSEDDRYCLVYPYLPNGSLNQQLHHQAVPPLTWQQRLAVLRGSAAALQHLHAAPSGPVVWGHVTSANILLDAALQPQLSTLGLARLRPPWLHQSCTTTTTTTTRVQDHLGYLPPEFIRGGKLCCSLDVYSFGMVRHAEQLEAAGKSPARELLWSWAQQNHTVADLIQVLQDMGHHWALQLLVQQVPNSAGSELKATQRRRFTYRDVLQGTWHFHHQMKIAEGRFSDTPQTSQAPRVTWPHDRPGPDGARRASCGAERARLSP